MSLAAYKIEEGLTIGHIAHELHSEPGGILFDDYSTPVGQHGDIQITVPIIRCASADFGIACDRIKL